MSRLLRDKDHITDVILYAFHISFTLSVVWEAANTHHGFHLTLFSPTSYPSPRLWVLC